ncbi:PqqD family protein [Hoeflea sp.]|uniref:PqqD family protein n=1 Tax=Hoeflea sp. TaxID=1940281 RepID=UPI003B015E3A
MPIIRITDKRLVKRVDKESIVYDQDDHKVYHLNEPAAKAWELCEDCDDIHQLAEQLSEGTELPADENVAQLALLELREAGLIEGEFAAQEKGSMTRRELLESLAHLAIALPVVVSMFAPTAAMAQSAPVTGTTPPSPETTAPPA